MIELDEIKYRLTPYEKELDEKSSVAKNATQLKRYDPRTKKDRIAVVDVN